MCIIIGTWNCPQSSKSYGFSTVGKDDLEESHFLNVVFSGDFTKALEIITHAEESGLLTRVRVDTLLDRLIEVM